MFKRIENAIARTYTDLLRNHTMQMAAALCYYFVLSLFPALIFLSAVVAYLPVPDLFSQALSVMARFLPSDSMGLVRRVLADVITPNKGTFLSFGILGTLWTASGGFSAAIEALNVAYEVQDDRPFWKTRPLAVGLAIVTEALLLTALSVMIVGPRFGEWLAGRVHLSSVFVVLWPYIHWSIAVGFTILAVEALYYLAPNVRQRFLATYQGQFLLSAAGLDCLICSASTFDISRTSTRPMEPLVQPCADDMAVLDRLCHAGGSRA
jgi:membrane protein